MVGLRSLFSGGHLLGRWQFDGGGVRIAGHRTWLYSTAEPGSSGTPWLLLFDMVSAAVDTSVAAGSDRSLRRPSPGPAAALCRGDLRAHLIADTHCRHRANGITARPAHGGQHSRLDIRRAGVCVRHDRAGVRPAVFFRSLTCAAHDSRDLFRLGRRCAPGCRRRAVGNPGQADRDSSGPVPRRLSTVQADAYGQVERAFLRHGGGPADLLPLQLGPLCKPIEFRPAGKLFAKYGADRAGWTADLSRNGIAVVLPRGLRASCRAGGNFQALGGWADCGRGHGLPGGICALDLLGRSMVVGSALFAAGSAGIDGACGIDGTAAAMAIGCTDYCRFHRQCADADFFLRALLPGSRGGTYQRCGAGLESALRAGASNLGRRVARDRRCLSQRGSGRHLRASGGQGANRSQHREFAHT